MRTTLTLDADVARALRAKGRARKISWKEVVNDTLRAGLGLSTGGRTKTTFVVKSHNGGLKPGIDPHKLGKLADELEEDHCLPNRTMAQRTESPRIAGL